MTNYSQGQEVCVVRAGTRPGASWADMLFAYVYNRLLTKVTEQVAAQGCDTPVFFSGTKELFAEQGQEKLEQIRVADATWADDSTMFTFDRRPEELLRKAIKMMATVLHQCCRYGLVPNIAKGKSALILALQGKGSHKAAAKVFKNDSKQLTVTTQTGRVFQVQVEANYLHLGGV